MIRSLEGAIFNPLNKGVCLSVLNETPITPKTRTIEVLIRAEEGFLPQRDVDVQSLRFGSFTEINFGRGCKPLRSRVSGDDLIVTFSGKGSGITEEEFAPKMIGRDTAGQLLYGYARLPYVDYHPALLSARPPVLDETSGQLKIVVENFGLNASQPTQLKLLRNGEPIANGQIPSIQPYDSWEWVLEAGTLSGSDLSGCEVKID